MNDIQPTSILTCPECGFSRREAVPLGLCQFFYECTHCGALLRPKPKDCCVFCSYGSVPCPSSTKGCDSQRTVLS